MQKLRKDSEKAPHGFKWWQKMHAAWKYFWKLAIIWSFENAFVPHV